MVVLNIDFNIFCGLVKVEKEPLQTVFMITSGVFFKLSC